MKTRYFSILGTSVLLLCLGCTLDEPNATDQSPALHLEYQQNLSLTTLIWDEVKVTGFKEYIILQSSEDIPNSPTPPVNQDVAVIKRIKEVEVNSFSISTVLFTSPVYYKIYCAVDDRFLYSGTISVSQDFNILPGFNDRGGHSTEMDEEVLYDRINHLLSINNYKTGSVISTVPESELSFPLFEISTWNNITSVYGYDQSPPRLRKYNYPSLSFTHFKTFNQVLWAVNVYGPLAFVAVEEFGNNFQVLNSNTLATRETSSGLTGQQNIAVFPGAPHIVLTLGESASIKYAINDAGDILSIESIPATMPQPGVQSSCAEGNELFICGRFGTIVNRDGENVGALTTGLNTFVQIIRLTPDEQKAIYLVSDNGVMRLQYADISGLPLVTNYLTYDVPALNYADLIVDENIVYLIGASFNSVAQTFILKYPLE